MDLIVLGCSIMKQDPDKEKQVKFFLERFNRRSNNLFFSSALGRFYRRLNLIVIVINPLIRTQAIMASISFILSVLYLFWQYAAFLWLLGLFAVGSFFYTDLFNYLLLKLGLKKLGIQIKRKSKKEIIREFVYGAA